MLALHKREKTLAFSKWAFPVSQATHLGCGLDAEILIDAEVQVHLRGGPIRLSEPGTIKNSILLILFLILNSASNFLNIVCFPI